MVHLCDSCDRFFNSPERVLSDRADLIEDGIPILQWDPEHKFVRAEVIKDTFPHFPGLAENARKGCGLCKIFIECLRKRIADDEQDWHRDPKGRMYHFEQGEIVSVWKG
jgi:hypothetical protein